MKISLDVTHTTQVEYDVEFPCYLQEGNNYFAFFDPINFKRSIQITDYSICKGIDYNSDFRSLNALLGKESTLRINKTMFQNKLVEILNIINGAVDEMHKTDEQ